MELSMLKWKAVLACLLLALVSVGASEVPAKEEPVFKDGANCLFIGHSFFIPVAKAFDKVAGQNGFTAHKAKFVFAGGPKGAPAALWNSPTHKKQIEDALATGKIDLLGMTAFAELGSSLDDYKRWIDLALKHNPNTRFFIGIPWVPGGTKLETDLYNKAIEGVGDTLFKTATELRKAYPKNHIFFINYGKVVSDLKGRYDADKLPDVTKLFGKGEAALFSDDTLGHGGPMILDVSAIVWLNTLYGADVGKLKFSAYKSDVKEIVGRVTEYNRKYK
jgi:hypothetical protein